MLRRVDVYGVQGSLGAGSLADQSLGHGSGQFIVKVIELVCLVYRRSDYM